MTTSILGSSGNDTLNGLGDSQLYGGAGNDTYYISSALDQAFEMTEVWYGSTGAITRISTNGSGQQANGDSYMHNTSADGRYVLMSSTAGNLVDGDSNRWYDLFVKDLQTGQITLVNRTNSQNISNGYSYDGRISADGRKVVFISDASNLVDGDTNGMLDVFVKDLSTGAITRLGQPLSGQLDGYVQNVSFSPDGQWIVYQTDSTNLVTGDTDIGGDVFMQSLQTGEIRRISQTLTGEGGNNQSTDARFSADGRYIIFNSYASNLVGGQSQTVYRYDTQTGGIDAPIHSIDGEPIDGFCSYGRLSPDGSKLVFASNATNLTANFSEDDRFWNNLFVLDLITGHIQQINLTESGQATYADGFSWAAHFTPDSQSVIFSGWDNLLPADTNQNTDIYLRDLRTGQLTLLSTNAQGQPSNQNSWAEYLSADGRTLFFSSNANNLVGNDTNGTADVFAKTLSAQVDAGGIDTVISQVDYQLADGLEHLTLVGNARQGTGNSLHNTLMGNGLDNKLWGMAGQDGLYGGDGADQLWGATGQDRLYGGLGDDGLDGGSGHDLLDGGKGQDQLAGSTGQDQLFGQSGHDVLYGGSGADQLFGGVGNDQLLGGSDDDVLIGSDGQDLLIGQSGHDRLEGGFGADTYGLGRFQGQDRIFDQDRDTTAMDVMDFGEQVTYQQLWLVRNGDDLTVNILGSQDQVTVEQWFIDHRYQIEKIEVAHNISLDGSEVAQLVNAMAALTPPASSQTTLNSSQLAALHSTFAVTWLD